MKKILALMSVGFILAACSGHKENPQARALLDSATEAFQVHDYNRATALLDSLQKVFPTEMAIQREGMVLRPQVIEQLAVIGIAQIDSTDVIDKAAMESLKPRLKWIKTPGMIEGYWIDEKAYDPSFMNSTGIEARVSEIGQFYIVSSANPSVKHTAIAVTGAAGSASTPDVAYDGESNYRIGGGEVITFSPEQSDTIGAATVASLAANATAPVSIQFTGGNTKTLKLTPAQVQGIANAYNYSRALIRARDNQVQRQRLEKTIEIARRQAAVAASRMPE